MTWATHSAGNEPMPQFAQRVLGFVQGGIEDDNRKLAEYGVDPLSEAAIPYYMRWIRQDIIGIYYTVSNIRRIAYIGILLLFVIAFFLFKIAYR
jgi:hypothetical protein